MLLGVVIQQPSDSLDYDLDFSKWIGTSGDVVASTAVTSNPVGLFVSAIVASPTRVKVWVSGGADGDEYSVEITTTTAGGRIKQDELAVRILEFV
jgi:hypothetical protein